MVTGLAAAEETDLSESLAATLDAVRAELQWATLNEEQVGRLEAALGGVALLPYVFCEEFSAAQVAGIADHLVAELGSLTPTGEGEGI